MKITQRLNDFLEKWDQWLIAGMLVPFLTGLFEKFSSKAGEKIEKKIEEAILGKDTAAAEKSIEDEILFRRAINNSDKKEDIESFRSDLKALDPEKAKAFVLYVAKILKATAKTKKETEKANWKKNGNKDVAGKQIETITTVYEFDDTNAFFKGLFSQPTLVGKIKFLEDENVFSLISKKKTPIIEEIRKFVESCKLGDLAESVKETTINLGKRTDKVAAKIAKKIEKEIYARDSKGKILKDSKGKRVLKEEHQHKGFWKTAFPTTTNAVLSGIFAGSIMILLICGFIFS